MMTNGAPDISVVIPVYNEAPNIEEVYRRVVATLEKYGRSFEVVAVDDGSSDDSVRILQAIHERDNRLRIVRLARNFGQTPALYAGFAHVHGSIVITIDADLQNPPEQVPKLIDTLEEGFDVVQGWREIRQDSAFRRVCSRTLNLTVSWLIGARIRDLGCGLKALRREVVDRLAKLTHHSRYLPAEIIWMGVRMAEVKVEHQPRAKGDSKYSLFQLLRLNFDMITSISTVPIKIIGLMGWLFSLVGFGMGARILFMRFWFGNFNPFVTVTALFFIIVGIQLIASSIMCEYIGRIFVEVQNKPYYVVRDVIE